MPVVTSFLKFTNVVTYSVEKQNAAERYSDKNFKAFV